MWSFISAILYISDIVFDALQCKTYHDFAYRDSSEDITVSKWYYYASLITWAGPLICLISFWFILYTIDPSYGYSTYTKWNKKDRLFTFPRPSWDKKDLEVGPDDDEETIKKKTDAKNRSFCQMIFIVPWELVFGYVVVSIILLYLYVPWMVFFSGVNQACACDCVNEDKAIEQVKEDKDDLTTQTTENSFLQLFEHIGEAIPQFALAITFYYNNFEYVSETDFSFEIFGFLVTQTLISMILSAISILKGIVEGIKSCYRLKAWKTRTEEIP